MADYALILHPADPLVCLEICNLENSLRVLGIIGESLSGGMESSSNWYGVGPHFLEQVTFLGCSPVVRFAAVHDGDTNFCRLHLPPPLPYPIWRAPVNAPPPRCPRCQAADTRWREVISDWKSNPKASCHICPTCGHATPLHHWRLREVAGFGRSFAEFWGIHPWEAVPGEELLATLNQLSGGPWRWFYWSGPNENT